MGQLTDWDTREPWESLANAIIVTACDDYTDALRELSKRKSMRAIGQVWSIRHFFHSDWFGELTSVDPDYILNRLEELYANERAMSHINKELGKE